MITDATRTAHARALTTGGLNALADEAGIAELRELVAYATQLIGSGAAADVAPAGGWWDLLTATLGHTPTALEVEMFRPGAWWGILRLAYARGGLAGLVTWCVPAELAQAVAVELLEDGLAAAS